MAPRLLCIVTKNSIPPLWLQRAALELVCDGCAKSLPPFRTEGEGGAGAAPSLNGGVSHARGQALGPDPQREERATADAVGGAPLYGGYRMQEG